MVACYLSCSMPEHPDLRARLAVVKTIANIRTIATDVHKRLREVATTRASAQLQATPSDEEATPAPAAAVPAAAAAVPAAVAAAVAGMETTPAAPPTTCAQKQGVGIVTAPPQHRPSGGPHRNLHAGDCVVGAVTMASCNPHFAHPKTPIWLCQPQLRDLHKDGQVLENTSKRGATAVAAEGNPTPKRPKTKKIRYVKCRECNGNPKADRCVNGMCKGCCKKHTAAMVLDCSTHRFYWKTRADRVAAAQPTPCPASGAAESG